jgi:hypothetical protein
VRRSRLQERETDERWTAMGNKRGRRRKEKRGKRTNFAPKAALRPAPCNPFPSSSLISTTLMYVFHAVSTSPAVYAVSAYFNTVQLFCG